MKDLFTPALTAHKGPRARVLIELKRDQPLAASELAQRLGVSVTAARRHLKELETEGLVSYGREQRGQGAPTYAYRLTQDGESLFPNRYQETVKRLIEHMVEREGRSAAVAVLEQQYAELRRQLGSQLDDLAPEEKLVALAEALGDAGFMAEAGDRNGENRLFIHNCAIHAAASCLPEICDVELDFIKELLGAEVERNQHIVSGCNACEYAVSFRDAEDAHKQESI